MSGNPGWLQTFYVTEEGSELILTGLPHHPWIAVLKQPCSLTACRNGRPVCMVNRSEHSRASGCRSERKLQQLKRDDRWQNLH